MEAQKENGLESKRSERFRFQLELSPPVLDRLDSLVNKTNSPSRAETLRRAIGFYWLLISETEAGNAIEIVTPKGKTKTLLVLEAT